MQKYSMQEEIEFWESVLSEYETLLQIQPEMKYLCNVPMFKNRWNWVHSRGLIINSAKEFLKETPKYSSVGVSGIAHLFSYDVGKERSIRLEFLNFIIQKLQCS